MLGITNLKPIESINSVLQPLGLKVSNKEQIISKLAWMTLATLTIYNLVSTVEAGSRRRPQYCQDEDRRLANCKSDCWGKTRSFYDPENAYYNCKIACVQTIRTYACRTPQYD